MILVGNKSDLEAIREVSLEEGKNKAKNYNCGFMEVSAKTKSNLNEMFYEMINRLDRIYNKEDQKVKKKKKQCIIF